MSAYVLLTPLGNGLLVRSHPKDAARHTLQNFLALGWTVVAFEEKKHRTETILIPPTTAGQA